MAEHWHILDFPDKFNPWIGRLSAKIHSCQRAIIKLFLVKVDFVDSITISKLYILISISEIANKSLVCSLNLILFFLIEAFAMARGSLDGFLEGLLDKIFFIPFYLLVKISLLTILIDALPFRFCCLLACEAESLQYTFSLSIYVELTLISNFAIFMLDLFYVICRLWLFYF